MEIKGKVHCLFEQSGTFKNEFIKLGIPAEDYDIQNNFGQTDHVVDLFHEIEQGYEGGASLFDNITPDDLVMAFFPCICFCQMAEYNQRNAQERWRKDGMPTIRIWELLKQKAENRYKFYMLCLKMHATIEIRGFRLIMENPWHETNYTNYFWFMKPSIIDKNRTLRGDYFVKPTAYWFLNCQPTFGKTQQITPQEKRLFQTGGSGGWKNGKKHPDENAKGSLKAGLCSEERSMISPDYARNFICDFILGKEQPDIDKQMKLFA